MEKHPFPFNAIIIQLDRPHTLRRLSDGDSDSSLHWPLTTRHFSKGISVRHDHRGEKRI